MSPALNEFNATVPVVNSSYSLPTLLHVSGTDDDLPMVVLRAQCEVTGREVVELFIDNEQDADKLLTAVTGAVAKFRELKAVASA